MDRIKLNTLLHNLYNKMSKKDKEKLEKEIILLSKEINKTSKSS